MLLGWLSQQLYFTHTHRDTQTQAHTHTEPVVSMTQHVSAGVGRSQREGIGDGGKIKSQEKSVRRGDDGGQ